MKAEFIFKKKFSLTCKSGRVLSVYVDLYKRPETVDAHTEKKFRFSWIAFDPEEPGARVLFDSHPPKGPHIHIDDDPEGVPFVWVDIDSAYSLFLSKIEERFGPLEPEEG